jgi:hypothetical protein
MLESSSNKDISGMLLISLLLLFLFIPTPLFICITFSLIISSYVVNKRNSFFFKKKRVGKQIVNVPSFMVRASSQKHIGWSSTSPFGGGPDGRVKRKNSKKGKEEGGNEEEDW